MALDPGLPGRLAGDLDVDHRLAGRQDLCQGGLCRLPDRRHDLPDAPAEMFADRPAIDVGQSLVDPYEAQIAIEQAQAQRSRAIDRFQLLELVGRRELGRLHGMDVGGGPVPGDDAPLRVMRRHGTAQMPAPRSVGHAEPVLEGVGLLRALGLLPYGGGRGQLVGMNQGLPTVACAGEAGRRMVIRDAAVAVVDLAGGVGRPDQMGHGIGEPPGVRRRRGAFGRSVGEVDGDPAQLKEMALVIADKSAAHQDLAHRPVGSDDPQTLLQLRLPGSQGRFQLQHDPGAVGRMDELRPGLHRGWRRRVRIDAEDQTEFGRPAKGAGRDFQRPSTHAEAGPLVRQTGTPRINRSCRCGANRVRTQSV